MHKTTTTLLLSAIIAMGIGLYGISGFLSDSQSTTLSSNSFMTGHLTLTAYNENGNVIAYRQTDNIVLNVGDNCISQIIFAISSGKGCDDVTDFDQILIGTGSDAGVSEADADPLPITFDSVATVSTSALTNASGTGGAATLLTASFSDVGANIDEASLRNAATASTGAALAYQQFTEIVLGAQDDLTVEWTVTIDGN